MANLPFADIAPVAIAIEAIHAGRRRGDLKITGIDLDSGDRMTVKVKSLTVVATPRCLMQRRPRPRAQPRTRSEVALTSMSDAKRGNA